MGWDGIGIQISFQSQRWPPPVPSQGVIKGQREGGDPPAPIQPQASHFAAAAHKTTVGLGARANIPRGFASQAGSRGPRSRRGPAGEGKAGGSETELPPPAWSRHVAAAPLGTAEKVRQEPGSPGGGEKVRRPHPHPLFQYRPVQPQTIEAQRFHSHFPLLGGAAAPRPLPPGPGRRRRRVGRQQGAPYLHSPLLDRAPSPYHPPPSLPFPAPPAPPDPDAAPPPPVPGQGRRMAVEDGVSAAGPRSGALGPEGLKVGSGEGDSGWRAGSARSGWHREKGRKEGDGGAGGAGARARGARARALTFSRRSRSPSSSRCRPCARSSASSACCCRAWILRFTASRELRPAMARRRTQRAAAGARFGSAPARAAAAAPRPPSLCLHRGRPRLSPPPARPPSGR